MQEIARARMGRFAQEPVGRPLFENDPGLQKEDSVCHGASETHLVGNDGHGHAFGSDIPHHLEHFANQFGIEFFYTLYSLIIR